MEGKKKWGGFSGKGGEDSQLSNHSRRMTLFRPGSAGRRSLRNPARMFDEKEKGRVGGLAGEKWSNRGATSHAGKGKKGDQQREKSGLRRW